ncbi:hypothetical protein LguiB_020504 [Lonicera macranthoides]
MRTENTSTSGSAKKHCPSSEVMRGNLLAASLGLKQSPNKMPSIAAAWGIVLISLSSGGSRTLFLRS